MNEAKLQELIKKYHVPVHINNHMKAVAAVALFIGQKIVQNGGKVDLIIVRQAALLHDLVKLTDFKQVDTKYFISPPQPSDLAFLQSLITKYSEIRHVEAGYQILKSEGEPEIAQIVRKHGLNTVLDENNPLITLEEKLVYYADKRVRHDQVVSIQARLQDLRQRYSREQLLSNSNLNQNSETELEIKIFQLEAELCNAAAIKPEDINQQSVAGFLEIDRNHPALFTDIL